MDGARALAVLLALASGCEQEPGSSADADGQSDEGGAAAPGGGTGASSDAGDGGGTRCSEPRGSYEAIYTALSGTCGPLDAPARIVFDATAGPATRIETFATFDVTTELVVQGCSVRVTQVVSRQGEVVMRIASDDLSFGEDGPIRGTATVTRFEGGATTCTGTYALELRRNTTVIGPGTGRDAGSADAGAADAGLPEDVRAKVEYDCQQTVQCNTQRGDALPPNALAECIANTSAVLAADADRVSGYVETVTACQAFVVCDYLTCAQAQR